MRLDKDLLEDDLFKCCRTLDADNSGTISLDEFLEFFGEVSKIQQDSQL
jgi:Ca2+-binding EF-hand superfamily protein